MPTAPLPYVARLTDESDDIEIVKSGAPEPSAAMLAWLDGQCRDAWSWDCDGAFNVYFRFADAEDAERFKARWGAQDA